MQNEIVLYEQVEGEAHIIEAIKENVPISSELDVVDISNMVEQVID